MIWILLVPHDKNMDDLKENGQRTWGFEQGSRVYHVEINAYQSKWSKCECFSHSEYTTHLHLSSFCKAETKISIINSSIKFQCHFVKQMVCKSFMQKMSTSISAGSVKISSGVAKEGPLANLQHAPQPSTQPHNSFLLLPKPLTLLVLVVPLLPELVLGFIFLAFCSILWAEVTMLKEDWQTMLDTCGW